MKQGKGRKDRQACGIPPPITQWTEKGGQEQFSDAESILSQRYAHYVGPSEI